MKKSSPSKQVLRQDFDAVEIAKAYEKGGAACISVLTERRFFQGSFENLENIRGAGVKCPLLCKDFIIDEWQIYYARMKGQDAVLLIAAVLSDADIIHMTKICKLLGLTALFEVHNEKEMDRVRGIEGIELIGKKKGKKKKEEKKKNLLESTTVTLVVAESGIRTSEHVAYVHQAGAKALCSAYS